jgi:hypothetical protein
MGSNYKVVVAAEHLRESNLHDGDRDPAGGDMGRAGRAEKVMEPRTSLVAMAQTQRISVVKDWVWQAHHQVNASHICLREGDLHDRNRDPAVKGSGEQACQAYDNTINA